MDEIEHRIYGQMPPQQEHNTDSEHCWCQPTIETQDKERIVVRHNDISEFFEVDKGH